MIWLLIGFIFILISIFTGIWLIRRLAKKEEFKGGFGAK